MNTLSYTEENYLKAIYHLSEEKNDNVSTNDIADVMQTKPASVSDMMKKLSQKELIHYVKYQGVSLTKNGKMAALKVIRKHRLWEVFLVQKLEFSWDEVHEIAEQLEHIQSNILIERLDKFLNYPSFDPHGDPIPGVDGKMKIRKQFLLSELKTDVVGEVSCLKETSTTFLKYMDKIGIHIGSLIRILNINDFDFSMEVSVDQQKPVNLSSDVCRNIYVVQ